MGETNKRNSRNSIVGLRWPISVPLEYEETLSSWLIRAALSHACSPRDLAYLLWPGVPFWSKDIDRSICDQKASELSYCFGVDVKLIHHATLRSISSTLSQRPLPKFGIWPWVIGLGARNRKYRGKLQFCPACFSEDIQPFMRREWRLSFNCVCSVHNIYLKDLCPYCHSAFQPQLLEFDSKAISYCSNCKEQLSNIHEINAPLLLIRLQRHIWRGMQLGWLELFGVKVSIADWLSSLRFLISYIRRAVNRPKSNLAHALSLLGAPFDSIEVDQIAVQFELLGVVERAQLLYCVSILINHNKKNIINAFNVSGVTHNTLVDGSMELPSVLQGVFSSLKKDVRYKKKRKFNSNYPKSENSVRKAWVRFKRKKRIT